jgi:hypothetical protein
VVYLVPIPLFLTTIFLSSWQKAGYDLLAGDKKYKPVVAFTGCYTDLI